MHVSKAVFSASHCTSIYQSKIISCVCVTGHFPPNDYNSKQRG